MILSPRRKRMDAEGGLYLQPVQRRQPGGSLSGGFPVVGGHLEQWGRSSPATSMVVSTGTTLT